MPISEAVWVRRLGAGLMMTTALVPTVAIETAHARAHARAGTAQGAAPSAVQADAHEFDIPAQTLSSALAAFRMQSGARLAPSNDAAAVSTPGVHGRMTPAEALNRLLAGTGLVYAVGGNGAFVLHRPAMQAAVANGPGDGKGDGADATDELPPVSVQGQLPTPYIDQDAPYKADRLSSSKFTEPVLNTARTVTVNTREVLDDKNATALRDVARSTAGVTLGSGEGGNAFGDRFFIRGFDARNDIFVDGVRDPGVSVRDDFNTEQVEILRGPASTLAGRGTAGGAINIVTKEARFTDFYRAEAQGGLTDATKRGTFDVNRQVNDKVAVRLNGMAQGADVAGRDFTTDNRWGIAAAVTVRPVDDVVIKGNYAHTSLWGLPDFGVPYDTVRHRPATEGDISHSAYFGIVNRDFTKTTQDLGTLDAAWKVRDWLTVENKVRAGYSTLNYLGTTPENPSATGATAKYSSNLGFFSGFTQQNAQSRYQKVNVVADEPQATIRFDTGAIRNTTVVGADFSRERIGIDTYTGLTSEITTGSNFFASNGAPISSIYSPVNYLASLPNLSLTGNPLRYGVDTKSGYVLHTANIAELIILNGGVRYDDYHITSSNNASTRSADNALVNYNANVVVKPIPAVSLYGAFATAATPVGAELDAASSAYGGLAATQNAAQIYGPLRTKAYELGAKWELFDRHMLASVAAFQTDVTNARETTPAGTPGYATGTIVSGAAYRVRGLDFELAGKITPRWSLLGGLVLLNTDVHRSIDARNIGLRLANVANQSFNLLSKYKVTDWFELGGQAIYASQIQGGSLLVANGNQPYGARAVPTVLPSHWRFDAFAEAKITQNLGAKLYVQNILNKRYYDSFYQSAQPFVLEAPGRSATLILSAKF